MVNQKKYLVRVLSDSVKPELMNLLDEILKGKPVLCFYTNFPNLVLLTKTNSEFDEHND